MIFGADDLGQEKMRETLEKMTPAEREIVVIFYLRDIAKLLNELIAKD